MSKNPSKLTPILYSNIYQTEFHSTIHSNLRASISYSNLRILFSPYQLYNYAINETYTKFLCFHLGLSIGMLCMKWSFCSNFYSNFSKGKGWDALTQEQWMLTKKKVFSLHLNPQFSSLAQELHIDKKRKTQQRQSKCSRHEILQL